LDYEQVVASAGRAKKLWGRCWEGVVAIGVAWVYGRGRLKAYCGTICCYQIEAIA